MMPFPPPTPTHHSPPLLICLLGRMQPLFLRSHCIRPGPKATNEKEGGGSPWLHDVLSPGNGLQTAAVVAGKSKKKAAWKEKKAVTGGNWAASVQQATQDCRFNTIAIAAAAALCQPLVSLRSLVRDQIFPVYKLRREIQGRRGRRYRSYHTRDCTASGSDRTTYYSGRQPLTNCDLCFRSHQRFLGFSGRK